RYPPGSFARSPREMAANFWDPRQGLHGLFDIWSFRGLEAVVASGLGGGSLIYANVLLRKPEQWFVQESPRAGGYEHWPVSRADLDPHYETAERMLGGTPYPFDRDPYARTPKTLAMQSAARRHGTDWFLPKLAVSFGTPDPVPGIPVGVPEDNLHRRQRYACRLCGECDIGCNYGSKNTTDY
ncbi:FAD-dependent oxidoreductase, partial [Kocuria sp. CPCC 205292]